MRLSMFCDSDRTVTDEHEVRLNIHGASRVSWDERRAYTKGSAPVISHKNSEIFLDHTISLLKKAVQKKASTAGVQQEPKEEELPSNLCLPLMVDEDAVTLNSGANRYPFELTLPRGLPGSFDGKWGAITYALKVTLHRPWKFDVEKVEPFLIKGRVDFNEEPDIVRPIAGSGDFTVTNGICCESGRVTVRVRVGRKGFVLGERLPFYVEVTNNSSRKMRNAHVALVQHSIFKTGNKTKKVTTVVDKVSKGEIAAGEKKVWDKETIEVPEDLPTTTNTKAIQIRYTMTVVISPPGWGAEDFTIPANITIGTIPLTQATVEKYIHQLKAAASEALENMNLHDGKSGAKKQKKPAKKSQLTHNKNAEVQRGESNDKYLKTSESKPD